MTTVNPHAPKDDPHGSDRAVPGGEDEAGSAPTMLRVGPTNSFADISGLQVGHATRRGDGWLTGTTVVLGPPQGVVAGVDVRGGGPGTRETDLLDPRNLVDRVHAICLTGGSAYGLAAADGVMASLAADGIGYSVGEPGQVVPIVPAAVIFDLARGGDFAHRPNASFGASAYGAARAGSAGGHHGRSDGGPGPSSGQGDRGRDSEPSEGSAHVGSVGAGTGAVCGGLKGGVGSASAVLPDGTSVACLLVLNAVGSALDPVTGELYARRYLLPGEMPELGIPTAAEAAAARIRPTPPTTLARPGMATTIGVVATDATLTKAQCAKLAGLAHDGLARAVKPVHTMLDGDTFFGLSTTDRPAPDLLAMQALLDAAGDVVTRAVARALVAAETVTTPAATWRGYLDVCASAWHPSQ